MLKFCNNCTLISKNFKLFSWQTPRQAHQLDHPPRIFISFFIFLTYKTNKKNILIFFFTKKCKILSHIKKNYNKKEESLHAARESEIFPSTDAFRTHDLHPANVSSKIHTEFFLLFRIFSSLLLHAVATQTSSDDGKNCKKV